MFGKRDIPKSMNADARTAELLDALAAEWGCSHSEALRRATWMAGAQMARHSVWIRRIITGRAGR